MLTVVKVGGGLAREAGDGALRALCRAIGDAGARHPLLVVPGGAAFADAVREHDSRFDLRPATAHRMAILAMEQFGWLLSDLIPGAVRCVDLAQPVPPPRAGARRSSCRRHCSRATRCPPRGRSRPTRSPPGWPVPGMPGAWCSSSRSKACTATGRRTATPLARVSVDELAELRAAGRAAGVDQHLPEALRAAGVEAWVIDGREPARLVTLLEHGSTDGTRVTP